MEAFKNRLLEFVKSAYGYGQNKFEDHCGLSHGTISSIKVKGPSADIVAKISNSCPELNLNWLFTGKGPMLNEKMAKVEQTTHTIPLIPIEAFAGPGLPTYEDERIEDYYTITDFKQSDFLIRVKGDSMVPRFNGGDIVACKVIPIQKTSFIQWGRVHVIYTDSQGVMIKRIEQSEKEGFIKCVSENPKYAPFNVLMEEVVSLALVNGAITLE